MPCIIDPGSDAVREAAFSCVDTYLLKLREVSERLRVEELERKSLEVTGGRGGGCFLCLLHVLGKGGFSSVLRFCGFGEMFCLF